MKQNLVDVAEFSARGGSGGKGAISWRREKFIQKGGPAGGNGGNGGSVKLIVDEQIKTLRFFAGKDRFTAPSGMGGSKAKRHGEDAVDLVIKVPMGTVVKISPKRFNLLTGRKWYGDESQEEFWTKFKADPVPCQTIEERWPTYASTTSRSLPVRPFRESEASVGEPNWIEVADLSEPGQEMVLAKGGRGGLGNTHYKSSIVTTPKFAQMGENGEQFLVRLELKILADVGLVGMPNVGKSTLLSVLTAASPEIANYPFTTLSPNLGVMENDHSRGESSPHLGSGIILADIPGLIEDAHKGKGLGIDFLKHVERCQVLVYVLAPEFNNLESNNQTSSELWKQFQIVKKEVESYSDTLLNKKSMVVVNKMDLMTSDKRQVISQYFKDKGVEVQMVSGSTHEGIEGLKSKMHQLTLEGP